MGQRVEKQLLFSSRPEAEGQGHAKRCRWLPLGLPRNLPSVEAREREAEGVAGSDGEDQSISLKALRA